LTVASSSLPLELNSGKSSIFCIFSHFFATARLVCTLSILRAKDSSPPYTSVSFSAFCFSKLRKSPLDESGPPHSSFLDIIGGREGRLFWMISFRCSEGLEADPRQRRIFFTRSSPPFATLPPPSLPSVYGRCLTNNPADASSPPNRVLHDSQRGESASPLL